MSSLAVGGSYVRAAVLAGDALMSIKPPKFISRCLSGVNFPKDWWWSLIGIKSFAATGLIAGATIGDPSVTTTVSVDVLGYFIIAHIKANFLKQEFWVNCLGMTALSAVVLALNAAAM
ncbi:hypothetical protein ACEN19_05985 [Corynebacterium auriscanis]|uniref:DoxX family protein n=1 Tax=Corynebacterium auriscanis TaxID=99807 RepID=UPI003CFB02C9